MTTTTIKQALHRFVPKSVICFREGYSLRRFLSESAAGVTVAIIALPLAMALGIASIPQNVADDLRVNYPWLSPPAMGLYTAVIAGFVISALGGLAGADRRTDRRVHPDCFGHR